MKNRNDILFALEISNLKKEIKKKGWNKKLQTRMAFELLFHLSLMCGGILVFLNSHGFFLCTAAIIISTIGATGVTTHTHSSSHHTTFKSRKLNNFLVYFGYTFLFGTSASYWWHKHIIVHHPNPNIYGVDDDIDLKPVFAFTKEEIKNSKNNVQRFLFRIQHITFPFALMFNGFNIQFNGWRFLVKVLKDRVIRNNSHFIDLFSLLLHFNFWILWPLYMFNISDVLLFHILRISLLGYGMYAAFAPAHFPHEAIVLDFDNRNEDFYKKQIYTTVNFKTNFFGRLICSGVDYQIEHHIFPGVCHTHYPKISERLKNICLRHGYPYRVLGWRESLWKSYIIFYDPKFVEKSIPVQAIS